MEHHWTVQGRICLKCAIYHGVKIKWNKIRLSYPYWARMEVVLRTIYIYPAVFVVTFHVE